MSVIAQASGIALPFADEYFHAVITSPPYYNLREYKGQQKESWSGLDYNAMASIDDSCVEGQLWEGALGQEPTAEMYISNLLEVCNEIFRVLRTDGVFWLNISDSYSGSGGAGGDYNPGGSRQGQPKYAGRRESYLVNGDMIGIPWRVALALQANGWILRRDVIWSKHPMPEPRKGWRWEQPPCSCLKEKREAHIKSQMEEQGVARHRVYDKAGTKFAPDKDCPTCRGTGYQGKPKFKPESWRHTAAHEYLFMFVKKMSYYSDHFEVRSQSRTTGNPLDVVHPQRENYSGKHFAVFPSGLVAPLIAANVPRWCCSICGMPFAPVVDKFYDPFGRGMVERVKSWRSPCIHGNDAMTNGRVLDPFFGSGTTGMTARSMGRKFAGTDISREYLRDQALKRASGVIPESLQNYDDLPMFADDKPPQKQGP